MSRFLKYQGEKFRISIGLSTPLKVYKLFRYATLYAMNPLHFDRLNRRGLEARADRSRRVANGAIIRADAPRISLRGAGRENRRVSGPLESSLLP